MKSNWELSRSSYLHIIFKKTYGLIFTNSEIYLGERSGRRVMHLEQLIWYVFLNSLASLGLVIYADDPFADGQMSL